MHAIPIKKRTLVLVATGALILGGANVAIAVASGTTATATCTPSPVLTYGTNTATLDVTCTVPLPPPVTVTVTAPPVTTTTTVTATPPPTTTTPPPITTTAPPTTTTISPSSGMANGTNTGVPAGTTLTASGGLTVTTANTVIDAKDITGSVTIQANNVTIKRSKIHGSGSGNGVNVVSGSVTVQDSEIYGFENGIAFSNWTATRVNLHGMTGDATKLGSNVTLSDSWVHAMTPAAGAHSDGGQMQGGETNLVVRHNNIDMTCSQCNSALFIAPDLGPNSNGPVTITGNWLNGGNYTLYCIDGNNGQYHVKNISITGNRFGRTSAYGPDDINVPITQSGNVWDDTSTALTL